MERLLQLIEIFILLWSVGTLANALLFGASMDDLRFSEVDEVRRRNLKLNTIEPITRKQKPFTVFSVVVVAIGIAVSFTRESNIPQLVSNEVIRVFTTLSLLVLPWVIYVLYRKTAYHSGNILLEMIYKCAETFLLMCIWKYCASTQWCKDDDNSVWILLYFSIMSLGFCVVLFHSFTETRLSFMETPRAIEKKKRIDKDNDSWNKVGRAKDENVQEEGRKTPLFLSRSFWISLLNFMFVFLQFIWYPSDGHGFSLRSIGLYTIFVITIIVETFPVVQKITLVSCKKKKIQRQEKFLGEEKRKQELLLEEKRRKQELLKSMECSYKLTLLLARVCVQKEKIYFISHITSSRITKNDAASGKEAEKSANQKGTLSLMNQNYSVGNHVYYGTYPQSAVGNDSAPIEWLVLDYDNKKSKVLLISCYGLDCKQYNNRKENVTWETCSLRAWLNGPFLNKAFSKMERGAILTTSVDNSRIECCSEWSTSGGNITQDEVFLLSYAEASRYFIEQSNNVSGTDKNIQFRVAVTAYTRSQGAYENPNFKTVDGEASAYWWLRSPGRSQDRAAYVRTDGSLYSYNVNDYDISVRPVFWLDISKV